MWLRISSLALLTVLSVSLLSPPCFTQSPPDKRPKLKDFGSSLKRLKWDAVTKKAVDTKPSDQTSISSNEDDVIRVETLLVTCDILVVDGKGTLVENLTTDDFIVTEDQQPQQIAHFARGDSATVGRSIVLILDYSRSQLPFLRKSINAAKLMVDKLAPLDLMAIVTDDVELLQDFTNDKGKLKNALESIVDRTRDKISRLGAGQRVVQRSRLGKSDQYSALLATLKEAFRPEDLRPIIVFQTDGDEAFYFRDSSLRIAPPPDVPENLKDQLVQAADRNTEGINGKKREFGLRDVYQAAERSRATIYTVVPGVQLINRTPEEQLAQMKKMVEQIDDGMAHLSPDVKDKLREFRKRHPSFSDANLMAEAKSREMIQGALAGVAERAGGWTEFLEQPEQAKGIYDKIFADINRRYLIGYYPTNKDRNGTRRKIKIQIKGHPDYYILGRTSYHAPGPQD